MLADLHSMGHTKMKGRGKGCRVHHQQGVCRVLPTAPPKTLAPSEAARMFPTHPSSQLPAPQMVGRRGRRRRGRGASRAGNSETRRLDGAWVAGRPPPQGWAQPTCMAAASRLLHPIYWASALHALPPPQRYREVWGKWGAAIGHPIPFALGRR